MNEEPTSHPHGPVYALIPAGGKSVRMRQPKLSLPLGGRTVLEWVIAALRAAAVEQIVVVVGPHVPQLAAPARTAGAHVCLLPRETDDMRATIEHGLLWLEERFAPSTDAGWLLVPADHPSLDCAVVRQLLDARTARADRSIFIPTFEGRRGHPALIDWRHVAGIRALPQGQGLNVYLRSQAAETLELPVASESILWDLDTPADYERLQQAWRAAEA